VKVLVSIHDVMPENMDGVMEIIKIMNGLGLPPALLLVTCGREWRTEYLERLRGLARKGHALAGHGWTHKAPSLGGFGHRLHALFLSRDCAEHLALTPEEAVRTMRRCHGWFEELELPRPAMYVPPAWGMGRVSRQQLRELGYRWYETLTGIYDARTDTFRRLPLTGFEADTATRKLTLTVLNRANIALGRITDRPVRLAIHPADLRLGLSKQLKGILESPLECVLPWNVK